MKNNKRYYIKTLLIVALTAISCEDYLDTEPITENVQEAIVPIEDAADAEAKVGSIYASLGIDRVVFDPITNADGQTDVAYAGGDNPNNFQQDEYRTLTTNANVLRDWDYYYNIIFQCNLLINNVDDVADLSDQRKREIKGTAYLFRAYFYFMMTKLWGEVPIVTTSVTSINSENFEEIYADLFPAKSSYDDIYNLMVSDLDYAKENLPVCSDQNSLRANQGGAYAMLAKIYATWPGGQDWDKVIENCDLAAQGRALVDTYDFLWDGEHEANSEGIWVIDGYNQPLGGPRISVNIFFGTQYKKFDTPSHALYEAYVNENDDIRRETTIVFSDEVPEKYPNEGDYAGIFESVPVVPWSDPYWSSDHFPFPNKFRIVTRDQNLYWFRLSDILLLKSEALVRKGQLGPAETYINMVRNRVELPDVTFNDENDAIEKLLHERYLELAYEGHRWYDLKRMVSSSEMISILQSEQYRDSNGELVPLPYVGNLAEYKLLMPIPQVTLDVNPNLEQNPGY
ncbi:RagB/SusD family nutrient uptake outer membrane protein [Muricauda sp. HICW]|uniref:RagB/SusD family nutrient uptake outer membrane protein n=1 Tax=Flagellimonas chongwuensis TaxID=2697365 RepID=A0A850NKK4_9FLAO|nr:RagB/SusD family nutrient uptake outer membrane protein [Allomuricauda chongwuensis]NVN19052.1 RagB/SusD family nutrient uptake outer membrane protein [Allomuricauda chongwuensis]